MGRAPGDHSELTEYMSSYGSQDNLAAVDIFIGPNLSQIPSHLGHSIDIMSAVVSLCTPYMCRVQNNIPDIQSLPRGALPVRCASLCT